jgi:hypothetical protein
MAIVDIPGYYWPYVVNCNSVAPAYTAGTLNASGDRYAFIVQCPKAGTLDKFEWRTGTVGNNPDNGLRMSFQAVSATTGHPDTTPVEYRDITGSFSATTWQVPGLMTNDGTDGGVKRVVTKGELLACVIDFVSFTASDTIQIATLRHDIQTQGLGQISDGSSGSYSKLTSAAPVMALKYNDGTYAHFGPQPYWPISAINTYTYNSGSTPDEYAQKFSLLAPVRVAGVWLYTDAENDFDIVLYDSGSSALATFSVDKDWRGSTNGMVLEVRFSSSISLDAGSTYRLAVKPGASSTSVYGLQCPSSSYMTAMPWGSSSNVLSTRTDAGAWTDDAGSDEQLFCGLIIDGIDDGTGSGGGGGSFAFVG